MRIAEAAQASGDLSQIAEHGSPEDLKAAHDRVVAIAAGMLPPPDMQPSEDAGNALRERVADTGVLVPNSMTPFSLPKNNADAIKAYGHLSTEDLVAKVREFDERMRAGEQPPQIARAPQAEETTSIE
jgi:hypothetical protein